MFRQLATRTRIGRPLVRPLRQVRCFNSGQKPAGLPSAVAMFGAGVVSTSLYFWFSSGEAGHNHHETSSHKTKPTNSTLSLDDLSAPQYASEDEQKRAFDEITQVVGHENVSKTKSDLDTHSDTYWTTHHAKETERPGLLVYPSSTEEVSNIMKICNQFKVPVIPFSGGTSLEGHFTPSFGGVCIDFSRMDKIVAYHKDDLDIVVQAGLGWEALNDYLSDDGLFFAPDPGPGAEIGGMIGTSCSGTNAGRYGTMKENVISMKVVLADGTIVNTRQRPRKSASGYNLTGLFIGSEGTLGLVTEATLKLTPRPEKESVGVVTFGSIKEAADAVAAVVQKGLMIGAVELLDDMALKSINSAGTTDRQWTEAPTLFFKFSGTKTAVDDQISQVREISESHGSKSFEFARDEWEREELWSARKHALWSMIEAAPKGSVCWTTDVAVPISRLAEMVSHSKEDMVDKGLHGGIVGHVLDGNYHCLIPHMPEERAKVAKLVDSMVYQALSMDGTATGEHGVGIGKKKYLEAEVGGPAIDVMRQLKQALDPLSILNPDKVITMNPDIVDDHS